MTEQVRVTQADREAAFPYVSRNSEAGQDMRGWLAGKYDGSGIVQAFARHRIAAQAELLEALELAVVYLSEVPHGPALKIATAIAKAKGEA